MSVTTQNCVKCGAPHADVYDPSNNAGPFCSAACMESRRGSAIVIAPYVS